MPKNSQTFAPGLYIVATPIGNLGDITLRAIALLKQADLVACEDTRVSGKLFAHLGIRPRTVSYHDHNADDKRPHLLNELQTGKIIALISDAGTPLVSDPGYKLVREAIALGVRVFPLPGASSVLAALCVCGLPSDRFMFVGFLPPKAAARAKEIASLAAIPTTLIFFESTRRLPDMLTALAQGFGLREAMVARELTKLHEEHRRGTLAELAAHYKVEGAPKGEAVVVVSPPPTAVACDADTDVLLREALHVLSVKDAAAHVAKVTGLPRQEIYARALALRKS